MPSGTVGAGCLFCTLKGMGPGIGAMAHRRRRACSL